MRVEDIAQRRSRLCDDIQPLPEGDISDTVGRDFRLFETDSRKRQLMRAISPLALRISQGKYRKTFDIPASMPIDMVSVGDRFADDASWNILLSRLSKPLSEIEVLIPGCYMGNDDVQSWLRRGVKRLVGIDIYSLKKAWSDIVPRLTERWGIPVDFRQGSIENIPLEDETIDMIATDAVLEHVRNLDRMVDETARVLKPGGFAFHTFGPLYHAYGGDHCIPAYGHEAGYDHVLLDETDYQARINDDAFFAERIKQPDLPFWAKLDQFSFARPQEYFDAFSRRFEIAHTIAKISEQGLAFRAAYPDKWQTLLSSGLTEADLLIKSLSMIVRKPIAS